MIKIMKNTHNALLTFNESRKLLQEISPVAQSVECHGFDPGPQHTNRLNLVLGYCCSSFALRLMEDVTG